MHASKLLNIFLYIFQYTILDPRNNDEEYSLGEMSAGLAIGLFNPSNFTYPELEQRMGSIEMQIVSYSFKNAAFEIIENITMATLNKETNPEFFYEGSPNDRLGLTEVPGLFTPKDPNNVFLRNNLITSNHRLLRVQYKKCSLPIGCAQDVEIVQFFKEVDILLMSAINYIDYDEVTPNVNPIKNKFDIV